MLKPLKKQIISSGSVFELRSASVVSKSNCSRSWNWFKIVDRLTQKLINKNKKNSPQCQCLEDQMSNWIMNKSVQCMEFPTILGFLERDEGRNERKEIIEVKYEKQLECFRILNARQNSRHKRKSINKHDGVWRHAFCLTYVIRFYGFFVVYYIYSF